MKVDPSLNHPNGEAWTSVPKPAGGLDTQAMQEAADPAAETKQVVFAFITRLCQTAGKRGSPRFERVERFQTYAEDFEKTYIDPAARVGGPRQSQAPGKSEIALEWGMPRSRVGCHIDT
jgi:hypothetical protein